MQRAGMGKLVLVVLLLLCGLRFISPSGTRRAARRHLVEPNVKTGAHHHGELETVLYIVKGRARFRWGDRLEFVAEAGPGDFIYVPPFVPHQEMNARADEPVEALVVRSGQESVVVNLDMRAWRLARRPAIHSTKLRTPDLPPYGSDCELIVEKAI